MKADREFTYAELRGMARAAAYSAIDCYRAGQHDKAREHLTTEGELIAEMRRMAPETDLSRST